MAPVLDLIARAGLFVLLALAFGLLKGGLDLLGPLVEDALKVLDHLLVDVLGILDVLRLVVPLAVVLIEDDVGLDALQGILELIGELVEDLSELFLLFFFAYTPVDWLEAVDQGLENVVDNHVEGGDGVLGDLTEQDLVVILGVNVHGLARWGRPVEVDTLALKSLLFTICDIELLTAWVVNDFTRLCDLVSGLIVHEDPSGASALKECVEDRLELHVTEEFLSFVFALEAEYIGDARAHPFGSSRHSHL